MEKLLNKKCKQTKIISSLNITSKLEINKNLLCHIYDFLNVKDILQNFMVCKLFANVAKKSPITQKFIEVKYKFFKIRI